MATTPTTASCSTRTDPDAPKHKGISYLLVPMRQPGVEVRGIVQPDGTAEFCEVFFTDARCPQGQRRRRRQQRLEGGQQHARLRAGDEPATTGYRRFEEEYKSDGGWAAIDERRDPRTGLSANG